MAATEPNPLPDLPSQVSRVLTDFIAAAQAALGSDLRAAVLFGSAAEGRLRATSDVNLLLLLAAFDPARAEELRNPLRVAQAAIRLSPMFILETELPAAITAFSEKFADILRRRKVLHGPDPFVGVKIPRDTLIARLDQVLLNLILRLREAYVMRGLREEQLALAIADAAGPLRSCAATLLELEGQKQNSPKAALEQYLKSTGESVWLEALPRISEAREQRILPPGVAGAVLLKLIDVAKSIRKPSPKTQRSGMLNPFDLSGPDFLIFYSLLGVLVLGGLFVAGWLSESGTVPRLDYSDPYLLAYLRGGDREVIRVAAVSLADRGLLKVSNDKLSIANEAASNLVRRPVERAILQRLSIATDFATLFDSATIRAACKEYKDKLQQLHLLPDEKLSGARMNRLLIALVLLIGVALIKIIVATMRGRQNIWFLILMAAVLSYIAVRIHNPFRTTLGNALLTDLRTLFAPLKNRASMINPGGATGEAALLMAVFGLSALPMSRFPIISQFREKQKFYGSSCGATGCGSTGSSCSGGSCGGGGGCGGCGGGS